MNSESADHLFARISHPKINLSHYPLFSTSESLHTIRSFDITSTDHATKSQLMNELLIWALVPRKFEEYTLSGQGVGVVLFDCELNFPIIPFAKLLEVRISTILASNQPYISDYTDVMPLHVLRIKEMCLSRLWIYKITSVFELNTNLLGLLDLTIGLPEIALVVIDGVSQYLWKDASLTEKSLTETHLVNRFVTILQRLVCNTNLSLVTLGLVYYASGDGLGVKRLFFKNKVWEQFFQCRVLLEKQAKSSLASIRVSNENQLKKTETYFQISERGIEIM